jgi:hypothetical protein
MTGSETKGIKTVLHPVSDLEAAKAVYTALTATFSACFRTLELAVNELPGRELMRGGRWLD